MYNLEKAAQKPTGEQNKLCFKNVIIHRKSYGMEVIPN